MSNIYLVPFLISFFLVSLSTGQDENWSEPTNFEPPVNSAHDGRRPSLTPDSDMMVLKTGRGDSSGLFTTHFADGQWIELEYVSSVGIPPSWTASALSPDGRRIYFSTENMGGEGGFDILYVERPTSISENIEQYVFDHILVYPNPSNSYFNILIEGSHDTGSMVFIYDILGRELSRMVVPENRTIVRWPNYGEGPEWLSSGVYFTILVGKGGDVRIKIIDITGRLVRTLYAKEGKAVWDALDNSGRNVSSGIYFAGVDDQNHLRTPRT